MIASVCYRLTAMWCQNLSGPDDLEEFNDFADQNIQMGAGEFR